MNYTGDNLPPVSTTSAANFATPIAGVVETSGKLAPVSTTPAGNLPPVSKTNNWNNIRLLTP